MNREVQISGTKVSLRSFHIRANKLSVGQARQMGQSARRREEADARAAWSSYFQNGDGINRLPNGQMCFGPRPIAGGENE